MLCSRSCSNPAIRRSSSARLASVTGMSSSSRLSQKGSNRSSLWRGESRARSGVKSLMPYRMANARMPVNLPSDQLSRRALFEHLAVGVLVEKRKPEGLDFGVGVAAPNAKDAPPAGQDVGHRVILRQPQRMPHRHDAEAAADFDVSGGAA